jgi:TonB family protein
MAKYAVCYALALAAALPAAGPAAAQVVKEVSPLTVTARPTGAPAPDVTLQVAGGDLRGQDVAIWPAGAREAGLSGYATLACLVDVHGLAETCRVIFEAPRGRGFGAAALALRPTFKVAPAQGPDGPIDATLKIAVDFKLPQLQTNLQEVATARAPPMGTMTGDAHADPGSHEISAANLTISDSPVAMRRMTMMTEPAWAQAPGFEAWAAAYPAEGGGVEGYAVAHCNVDRTGALGRCAVVKELPAGHGFGKAAVALAARFRASPEAMAAAPHGAPVEVDVPVRFPPPGSIKDRTIRAPAWIAGADPETLARDLPAPAPGRKPGAGAVVQCQVGEGGTLAGCEVEFTSPDGLAFDEAAVRLASRLRMNLWSAEASPVVGGVVHLPVRAPGGQQAQR